MKKDEFLNELRNRLKGLPQNDVEDRISFYNEMIEDRMSEGYSEEKAVEELGGVDKVVNDIARDTPLVTLVKERVKPNRSLRGWEIVLLILGFPLWFPLLLTFIIMCFVAYLLIWVMDFVVYAIEAALVVAAFSSLIAFFALLFTGEFNLLTLGSSLMAFGGAILMVFACIGVTKATLAISKGIFTSIKSSIIKKGRNA